MLFVYPLLIACIYFDTDFSNPFNKCCKIDNPEYAVYIIYLYSVLYFQE